MMVKRPAVETGPAQRALGRRLVLDELFDLALYRTLRRSAGDGLRRTLDELIPIETRHAAFWQRFFGVEVSGLDWSRRLKLGLLGLAGRLGGDRVIHLVLEAIEVHGVRKYLALWERYRGGPLGDAVREILDDEFRHEDRVVSEAGERRIDPEGIRNVFLGFNDGLVEILGAVSGLFAAFGDVASILIASLTLAAAGAFSMGAGTYVAVSSEGEMKRLEAGRRAFLGDAASGLEAPASPLRAALLVGGSYLLGALVPVTPVLLGARTVLASVLTGAVLTVVVSAVLAFLSGMALWRRLVLNVAILAAAVAVTYGIGLLARTLFGISPP